MVARHPVTVKRRWVSVTAARFMVTRRPITVKRRWVFGTAARFIVTRPAVMVNASRFTENWPAFAVNRLRSR
jgi:hypothetical protein